MKNHLQIKKLTLTALFTAVAVVGSMFSFPVLGSKCAPVQHLVNVLCAVTVPAEAASEAASEAVAVAVAGYTAEEDRQGIRAGKQAV